MRGRVSLALCLMGIVSTAASHSGCLGSRCSPGQILKDGACVLIAPDGSHSDSLSENMDSHHESSSPELGAPCGDSSDCSGKADFCVVMPGKTTGYCTYKNCTLTPNDCPAPYICIDLSIYMPNLPTGCIKI
jgi:hypothetical protein